MIYSLRMLSDSLSIPEYATFVIIMGLAGWFALMDLGIGFATQNAVTERLVEGGTAASEVLSAYLMLAVTTSVVALALYVLREPIAALLFGKILGDQAYMAGDTFFRSALLLSASASFAVSTKVLYAMHRGFVANAVSAFAPVVGLVLLALGVTSAQDKVAYAVVALFGPNAFVCCLLAVQQIVKAARHRPALPKATFFNIAKAARGFFVFNVLGAAVLQIDYLVMSQKVSSVEIIQYFTIGKIFFFIAFINQAVLFATWPTLTALYVDKNLAEIRRQIKRLILISAGVTTVATLAILASQDFIGRFLVPGKDLDMRSTVVLGFSAIALIRCVTDPFAIFLQSIGELKPLIAFAAVQSVISVGLQWTLAEALSIEGILLALFLSFVLTTAWGLPLAARKLLVKHG